MYLVRVVVSYAAHLTVGLPPWPEAALGFSHRRFFNQMQTWTLPLLLWSLVQARRSGPGVRMGLFAMAACWWMLVLASGGRGTLLALLGGLALLAMLFRGKAGPWLRAGGGTALTGLVLYVLLYALLGDNGYSLFERNLARDSGRLYFWREALRLTADQPWLGVGPMHYAHWGHGITFAHPHNAVMQWLSEWGVPATLIAVGLIGWGMLAWLRHARYAVRHRPEERGITIALTWALAAGAAHALLSGIVVMPVSQMLMVVVVGWALGCYQPPHRPHRASARAHRLLAATVALALLAVGLGVAPDLPGLPHRKEIYTDWTGSYDLRPRYWQQGFIGYETDRYPTEPVHPK
ncbi:MAG: O-antigen ligase domain-containing protein [Bacteroidetes bacterium]|nr:MAG: O-antigen ligase domain-containing protein [Bacteroidota bacterium]